MMIPPVQPRGPAATTCEFRSLAENSPDYIVRHGLDGRILFANATLATRLKVAGEALVGRSAQEAFFTRDPAVQARYQQALDTAALSGRPSEIEATVPRRHGGSQTFRIRFVAERAEGGDVAAVLVIGSDITELKRAEAVLRRREQEFRALVEQSADLIARYDRGGWRVYANPALQELLEAGGKTGLPAGVQEMIAVEADHYRLLIDTVLSTGQPCKEELSYRRPDGSLGWLDVRLSPENNEQGAVGSVFAVARDITEGVQQRERIKALALSDPLTRLHNRQALYDYAPGLISEAERHGRKLGVMILDVDRFKNVNDTLGHPAGDALLRELAQRLAECTRGYDLLTRLGGDEFAIVAGNIGNEHDMAAIAEKIEKALAQPLVLAGRQVVVSASMGIALFPADGERLEDLMAHADVAMYHAKRGGRSRYEFYQPELGARARERLALEQALREAVEHLQDFELHYQPLVSLHDGGVVGAEALLRWRHAELGLLMPDRFIPIAEDTGLIVPIGRWVIEQAAQAARRWNQGRGAALRVAVNVSTRQFLCDDVAAVVGQALQRTGCRPEWLGIEVTESLLLEDSARVRNALRELRGIGLQVSIDDFGTGYSALNYLAKFDVSCLKIDRQFVHEIESDARQAELVKAFIGIARALGLAVVAEGIESSAQAAFLLQHGCSVGQGYLFCRPAPAAQFEQDLQDGRWDRQEFSLV